LHYNSRMRISSRCGLFFFSIIAVCRFNPVLGSDARDLDLEPIVITKSRVHLSEPYTLDNSDLESSAFGSFLEGLRVLPLDVQSRSPLRALQDDFSLRGSSFQGVLMLLDGQRLNDPQTAHYNSDIPLTREDVERIEVLPGVSSSLFGPDAVGGAVNIIRKKPRENERVIEVSAGTHKLKSVLASLTQSKDDWGVRLSVESSGSSGFRYDTDFNKFTSTVNTTLRLPAGSFDMDFGYQEKEFGAFDFYTPGAGYPSTERTKTYLFDTGFLWGDGEFLIKPNFLWRRHYDTFVLDKTEARSKYRNQHRSDLYTPNIYFQKDLPVLGKAGFGIEYGDERINSSNLGKHARSHQSLFFDDSKDLIPDLSLGASGRFDTYDSCGEVYTGSLNCRYHLRPLVDVLFGVSRSMRIPSFTELYYNDPTTIGEPGLSAEEAFSYQAGVEYKKERHAAGVTVFLRQEHDFIDWVKLSPAQEKWHVENITEANVFGVEQYARADINRYFSWDANYAYTNKRIDEHGYSYKYGQNYSRHIVNSAFNFNLPFGKQSLGLTYKQKPARDGWVLLNAHLSCNLKALRGVFMKGVQAKEADDGKMFINITNLLNVNYQEIEGIDQPGRWVEAGVRFEW
jgi:vitamin B12 transporter